MYRERCFYHSKHDDLRKCVTIFLPAHIFHPHTNTYTRLISCARHSAPYFIIKSVVKSNRYYNIYMTFIITFLRIIYKQYSFKFSNEKKNVHHYNVIV